MGFEIKRFQGDVDEEFICPICKGVLEDPLQAPACEHAFCRTCISEWISEQPTCPVDRQPVTASQLRPVPRVLRNLLSSLRTSCDNAPHGCNAVMKLDSLASHLVECSLNSRTATASPFGGSKPTAGTSGSGATTSTQPTTSGGSLNSGTATASPFGGFKPTAGTSGSGATTSTQPTTGGGSLNSGTATASPFGGFKPTAGTSGIGATTSTQPTTGRSLFGTTNTTGGLFDGSTASTSTAGFGASTSGFGFGAAQPAASGGLFSNTNNVGGGLFGNTHNQWPSAFSWGGTPTTGATTGSQFGAARRQPRLLRARTSLSAGAFGQQQQQQSGTAHVQYKPVVGTDVVEKWGKSQLVDIKHHCITVIKEYENKSLEELRLEDYVAGRDGNTSVFGGFQQQTENDPYFGKFSFGPAPTNKPSVFANNARSTNSARLFGANTPSFGAAPTTAGTGLFAQSRAPTFRTNTSSTFEFGSTTQNQLAGNGLFGEANPATFGTQAAGEYNPKRPTPCKAGCGLVIQKDKLAEHNCVRELRALIATHEQELAEHKRELALLKESMQEMRLSNPCAQAVRALAEQKEREAVARWAAALPRATVTRWAMILTPNHVLQII